MQRSSSCCCCSADGGPRHATQIGARGTPVRVPTGDRSGVRVTRVPASACHFESLGTRQFWRQTVYRKIAVSHRLANLCSLAPWWPAEWAAQLHKHKFAIAATKKAIRSSFANLPFLRTPLRLSRGGAEARERVGAVITEVVRAHERQVCRTWANDQLGCSDCI